MPMLVFLDITTSSVAGGAPVAVAWVAADLSAGASWLVRPAPDWDDSLFDPDTEAVHGPTREQLETEGRDARRVALLLAEDLADTTVASVNPARHEALLDVLFENAPFPRPFVLRDADGLRRSRWGEPDESDILRTRSAVGLTPGLALDGAVELGLSWMLASGAAPYEAAQRARELMARL